MTMRNRVPIWLSVFGAVFFWNIFLAPMLTIWLRVAGLSPGLIQLLLFLLFLLLLLEVMGKILIVQAVSQPLQLVPMQRDACEGDEWGDEWDGCDRAALTQNTAAFKQLGFVQLQDFTTPAIKGGARLMAHPQLHCFVEIGQVQRLPMFCTLGGVLERHWDLNVTNTPAKGKLDAISYAFLRHPQVLTKRFPGAAPEELLQAFLDWRQQVTAELNIQPVPFSTAEDYFAMMQRRQRSRQQALWRKSIIWGLVEAVAFCLNPRSEWLGNYAKAKQRL